MLRKLLEDFIGPLSDSEFRELMKLCIDDIRANHLTAPFRQKTSLAYLIQVAVITFSVLQNIKMRPKAGRKNSIF